jgi:GAF domain-containing protein/anti-sigma regulatory factor (Ser/Thr protein kinase)
MRIQAVRGFEASAAHLGLTLTVADDALVREIVNTQRPLILADAQQDERFHSLAGTDWVRSWLGVPLLSKEQVIGLITINAREADLYAEGMAELALALGRQAAIAIENARLYEETKRRADEMTVLYHTSLEIGVPTDLPDLLWTLCDRAAGLLGVDKGGLYLYDEAREELELVVSYKLEQDFTGTRLKLGEGVAGRVVQTGQPLTVDDYSHWEGRVPAYEEEPFGAVIAAPLRWQEQIIGVATLSEETKQRTFTPDDERLLGLFAQQAAVVIESARLYEEARRRVEELVALHAIDVTIASTLNLDEMLQRIYEQVSTVMNTTTFHIALYDEEKGELYLPIIVDQGKQLPPRTLQVEDGLSGWVVRTREPLWIEDMERERATLPAKCIALGAPTRSLMVLPLIAKDKVVGVISAQSHEPHAFDAGHRHLFSGIASQVAIAIENARLFEETRRRLNELSLLHDVALTSTATLNFDEILCHTVESVHSKLQLDVFGFLLVDEEAGIVRLHPTFLGVPDDAADFTIPLGEGITGWVAQTGHPLLAPDVSQEPRYRDTIPGIRSEVCVPLKIGDKVIGVINAESTRLNAFSEDDVRLFSTLASQLGVALENARLFEETNRRLAETRLLQEMMQAAASTLDFDQVLTRTIETLRRTLDVDYLGFALLDDSGTAMIPHPSMIGFPTPPEGYLRLPLNESIIGRVYQTGEPLLTADVSQIPYYFEVISEIRSELAVPVRVGDKVVGVLNVESHALAAFDEDDLHLFTAIAAQLGVVLENTRLYQTLQERTEELSQAYEELKELDRLRTELVQNVGHELRTPLTLVQGYVELLLAGDLGHISDSQWAALQIVHERTDTLVRLIHNLTMLQTMPRETLMPVSVSVVEVVRHALTGFRHFADKVGVALREELPSELPPVMGDQEQLELAFSHLVDNAVKFSPDGGTITLRAWADKAWVYVSVADEGIGIAPDHLDNIFERFYQVDGTPRRRFGGMGIGLAVVWEIVEAHGGTVNVESKPEKGSTFTVALARA